MSPILCTHATCMYRTCIVHAKYKHLYIHSHFTRSKTCGTTHTSRRSPTSIWCTLQSRRCTTTAQHCRHSLWSSWVGAHVDKAMVVVAVVVVLSLRISLLLLSWLGFEVKPRRSRRFLGVGLVALCLLLSPSCASNRCCCRCCFS
jgi:hypothetical protein